MDDIDFIPLKNLPFSGLTAFEYFPYRDGDKTHANNVLIACIDNLDEVSLVGRTKDGQYWFASSISDPSEVLSDLDKFADIVTSHTDDD